FWSFLHGSGWIDLLEKCLPHPLPKSNNHIKPLCKALGFVQGLLCGAKKLTHVAYLRRDPMVPEMVGIKRVPSQSVLTRFFQGFSSAGHNLRCFRRLFGWCLDRLPSREGGYALDFGLDSFAARRRTPRGSGGGLHPLGDQALLASTFGGVER